MHQRAGVAALFLAFGVLPAICLPAHAQETVRIETAGIRLSHETPGVADAPFAVAILRDRALYNDDALYGLPDKRPSVGASGIVRKLPMRRVGLAAQPSRRAMADEPSKWASFDKLQHVTFSFLMTIGAQYTLVEKLDVSSASAVPVSAGSSLAVGVAKELYDRQRTDRGRFDVRDLVADLVGVTLGVALILI